jgi:hypothetical protein
MSDNTWLLDTWILYTPSFPSSQKLQFSIHSFHSIPLHVGPIAARFIRRRVPWQERSRAGVLLATSTPSVSHPEDLEGGSSTSGATGGRRSARLLGDHLMLLLMVRGFALFGYVVQPSFYQGIRIRRPLDDNSSRWTVIATFIDMLYKQGERPLIWHYMWLNIFKQLVKIKFF